jgi:hypothetical protein
MVRRYKIGNRRNYPRRRVAYIMTDGKKFYEKQPRNFPYGITPYVQNFYWDVGYCVND